MRRTDIERSLEMMGGMIELPKFIQVVKKVVADFTARSGGVLMPEVVEGFVLAAWYDAGQRIYRLAEVFGAELHKAPVKVAVSYLPGKTDALCVEFPDGVSFTQIDGSVSHAAYVAVSGAGTHSEGNFPIVHVCYPDYDSHGARLDRSTFVSIHLRPEFTLEDAIAQSQSTTEFQVQREALSYVVKALLYIHSGEPDLRQFKPPKVPHPNSERGKVFRLKNTGPLVPITLVGFDYKKPRTFSVDETSVTGHFRWQPWGPSREKVKLIWIDEHIRKFGHEHKESQNENA